MNKKKLAAVAATGGAVYDDAADWLGLTDAERELVELRLTVARAAREAREAKGLTQDEVARRIGSSQSRVAKVEAAAAGVSLDLAFKTLFAAGGRVADLGRPAAKAKGKTPTRKAASPQRRPPVAAR